MKLKLHTPNASSLLQTLSLVSQSRKYVILRFTPTMLYVISVNQEAVVQEPQIWCKVKMSSVFDEIEIQSLNDNVISLELNGELLLQTLRHFDRANSDGLIIRLQKKESIGGDTNSEKGRTVSLALFYSHINANSSSINHKFKIPARVLKNSHEIALLEEPELTNVDLIMNLPNEFVSTYKRLDRFKKSSQNDVVTIKSSRRSGGFLGFVLEEEGKFKVTISWNEKLDIRRPPSLPEGDSLINNAFVTRDMDEPVDEEDISQDKQISVKLKDWKMASKIVAGCKTVILLLADREACVLHCLLDDTDDVEIIYSINALKIRNTMDE